MKLLRYGDDSLVSRSQAKRLLARFDKFKVVLPDFSAVASVGQAFADEVQIETQVAWGDEPPRPCGLRPAVNFHHSAAEFHGARDAPQGD